MSRPSSDMSPTERRMDQLKSVATIVMTLVIVGCAIAAFRERYREKAEIAAHPHYTVGEVTRTGYVIGPSPESIIHFTYQVGDSTYQGTAPGDLVNNRTRFLVRFSTQDPSYYEAYKKIPIPYYVPPPPPEGWAKPPVPLPADAE